jgi:hypothetical protein
MKAVLDDIGAFRVDTRDTFDPGDDGRELIQGSDLRFLQSPPRAHGQAKTVKRIIGRLVATRAHSATKSFGGAANLSTVFAAPADNAPTGRLVIIDLAERYQYLGRYS